MISAYGTECCGVHEITGLGTEDSAEVAMINFCEKFLRKGSGAMRYGYGANGEAKVLLYSHYTFTAAVYDKECSTFKTYADRHPSKVKDGLYHPYGHEFAAFIQENKLGEVVTTGPRINKLYHPDHKVQIWVWTPDQEALEAWYEDRSKFRLAEEARKAMEQADAARKKAEEAAQAAMEKFTVAMRKITPDYTLNPPPKVEGVVIPKVKRIVRPRAKAKLEALNNNLNNIFGEKKAA